MTTELPPLAVAEFADYFGALWAPPDGGDPPVAFGWQRELAEQLDREHAWPDLVDLPTGTGKTSVLDIALFAQALDAERDPGARWMPRRVVLVVDRRVIVDQADDRGRKIAHRLADAPADGGVLSRVAARLRHLGGTGDDEPPVVTSVLRGGIVRDESWARRPDVPALISSTVDQVGSRLLFRGYGISSGMRPVHAGLLANDCLMLLDEVHLARPFAQTLAAVGAHRARAARRSAHGASRWHVVELSATPTRAGAPTRFPSAPLDSGSHPVLQRRLLARKPARLEAVQVAAHPGKADREFAQACVTAASVLLRISDIKALGVIVNRVSTARLVARGFTDLLKAHDSADVVLLTGRMRPIDRDRILGEHRARLEMGRDRGSEARPLVVVATQSIEAGADFDLDAIVTECASLDALRQRFGRVDRDGQRSEAGTEVTSVILARSPVAVDDAVYGGALARTWEWLEGVAEPSADDGGPRIDFGIRALALPGDDMLEMLVPPVLDAPVMLPAHLDAWVQTSPRPAVEPDVARWLHGIHDQERDLQVVWRDDLHKGLLDPGGGHDAALLRVLARPPVSTEAMSLPLGAVRRWLLRQEPAQIADVEGARPSDDGDAGAGAVRDVLAAVRWAGEESEVIAPKDIRPGDALVVPCSYGGIDLGSWAPDAREAIDDIAVKASRKQRRLAVVRLTVDRWSQPGEFAAFRKTFETSTATERRSTIESLLASLGDRPPPDRHSDVEDSVAAPLQARVVGGGDVDVQRSGVEDVRHARHRLRVIRLLDAAEPTSGGEREPRDAQLANPFGPMVVITAPARAPDRANPAAAAASTRPSVESLPLALADEGDDEMSFSGRRALTLAGHLSGVECWAAGFSERLGIDAEVASDIRLAARLHDIGKADSRFQTWLHDGDELASAGSEAPLAKSATPYYDRARRAAARKASRYPPGARHELTSVAMVAGSDAPLVRWAHDPELVLHLIASHHGLCRGFSPVVDDPDPIAVIHEHDGIRLQASSAHGLARIDSGIAERYWRLVGRYGWFGLAWLEAILRLADHRCSEEEEGR